MKNEKKVRVVIQSAKNWQYFLWFLLGFYELEKAGEIKLDFELSLKDKLRSNRNFERINKKFKLIKEDSYNLYGYVLYPDNNKKTFCIDCADSPFLFSNEDLNKIDCYFKMQCPKNLERDYFTLTDDIHIPWLDHFVKDGKRDECVDFKKNRNKIKPLMIGPRRLATSISYKSLKKGYNNYIKDRSTEKSKKIMCYFGNSQGPKPIDNVKSPDFNKESEIVGYYKDIISHPNEKRAIIADILNSLGSEYDGRVISQTNSDSGKHSNNADLVVPIKDFCSFISKFQYNFNVSGYRLSIPNRFIESFIVGTGIITDKLSVKWYLPFSEDEVKETETMGYVKNELVNWDKVKEDIKNIKNSNPKEIISCFEKKWSPKQVAKYMLEEIKKS